MSCLTTSAGIKQEVKFSKIKERPDLSINNKDIESVMLEILSDKPCSVFFNVLYRPPIGQFEQFENFLTIFFSRTKSCNKDIHIAGDFNLNLLDHDTNKKVQVFLNLIYQNSLIPILNKPTRVTMKTATAINHLFTNPLQILDQLFLKLIISDHFPVCVFLPSPKVKSESKTTLSLKELLTLLQLKCLDNSYN